MNIATNILENFGCSCEIGTQTTIKSNTIKDLFYTKLCLAQKFNAVADSLQQTQRTSKSKSGKRQK
jgi:hypothetical protein